MDSSSTSTQQNSSNNYETHEFYIFDIIQYPSNNDSINIKAKRFLNEIKFNLELNPILTINNPSKANTIEINDSNIDFFKYNHKDFLNSVIGTYIKQMFNYTINIPELFGYNKTTNNFIKGEKQRRKPKYNELEQKSINNNHGDYYSFSHNNIDEYKPVYNVVNPALKVNNNGLSTTTYNTSYIEQNNLLRIYIILLEMKNTLLDSDMDITTQTDDLNDELNKNLTAFMINTHKMFNKLIMDYIH